MKVYARAKGTQITNGDGGGSRTGATLSKRSFDIAQPHVDNELVKLA